MTSPASTVPSRERVLRALFWQLLFRGRAAQFTAGGRPRRQLSLGWTLFGYVGLGLLPALAAFALQPLAFASTLHAMTLMFASLTLASSAGTVLFVREEAEILLHRPVRAEELLRAKAAVLIAFALLLALALNAGSFVTSFWNKGNAPWFPLAHALGTLVLMLFSAAAIVLVYNLCLCWFGRERFENLLATLQTLLAVLMVCGGQLVPRLATVGGLQQLDASHWWAALLPPVWFGALDMLLCGQPPGPLLLPAAIGLGATALLAWLAFARLGSAYGVGLMALNESAGAATDRPRRRLLSWLVVRLPLRAWLRDPVERHAFLLASAYLVRDRETKLKLYPALAPMVMMPVVMALGSPRGERGGRVEGPGVFLASMALGYAAIVPIQALMQLRRSEQWRAADLFRTAPLPHWTPLFHGTRKAVLCWLALPALAAVAAILAAIQGSWSPLAMLLPAGVCTAVSSCVPGVLGEWLPLSQPNTDVRNSEMGCLLFGGVLFVAMGLGAVAAALDAIGWFWPFLVAVMLLAVVGHRLLLSSMRNRPWRAAS